MVPRSNIEWKWWGEMDPLWGVSSVPGKKRSDHEAWNTVDFYQSGRATVDALVSCLRSFAPSGGVCLEIGCGAGRLTRALASHFGSVIGLDVSPGMVRYARSQLREHNVGLCIMDGNTLPIRTGSVNTVFSFWVFQHFDNVGIGFEYLKEAYRVLAPDGTLLLQLPIYHLPRGVSRPLTRLVYGCSKLLGDLRAKYYRERLKRGASLELMRGTEYDAEQVLEVAHSAGFSEVEYRSVYLSASGSRETIVLARK